MADRCTGTTKKGHPCQANPLHGTDRCLAHSDREARESVGFGGPQPGAGRPRVPGPTEVARQVVEANVVALLRPYFEAVGLELHDDLSTSSCEGPVKYVWAGTDEPALAMKDLGAAIGAVEKLLDRIYGRPKQQTELTGAGGGPVTVEHGLDLAKLSDEDLAALERIRARAAQ